MASSDDASPVELVRRITDLELRVMWQDDLVRQLDDVVRDLAARVDALRRELDEIHARGPELGD